MTPDPNSLFRTPEYRAWGSMKHRCDNPRSQYFKDYGGRGISYVAPWASFKNFLADMGRRPQGHSLDRIDTNGNYEPGNCQWATPRTQAISRRASQGGSSKYRGVHFGRASRKWRASITVAGKTRHLGTFNLEVDAALAYNAVAAGIGYPLNEVLD